MKDLIAKPLIYLNKLFLYKVKRDVKIVESAESNDTAPRKKVKIKHGMPLIQRLTAGKELMFAAFIIGALLILLLLAEPMMNSWSVAKWTAGINQDDNIELPGKNIYDK